MKTRSFFAKSKYFFLQGITILLISFILGEIVLRTYHYFNPAFIFHDDSYNQFRGKPFSDDWNFKLNAEGFKDKAFTEKKEKTYRIIGIGDSFAFGIVPYEYNYLTLLEAKLQEQATAAEVFNMGIPSIGPRDYLTLLVREGLAFDPDMILLSFFIGNDFLEKEDRTLRSYSYVASLIHYIMTLKTKYKGQIIHGKHEYCDSCPSFDEKTYLEIERDRSFIFFDEDENFPVFLEKTLSYLDQIKAICEDKEIDLAIVLIPDELQVNSQLQEQVLERFYPDIKSTWNTRLPNQKLAAKLDELGIDYIDLYENFAKATEPLYRSRDSHWNIAGNELAANIIKDYLLTRQADFLK